MILYAEQVGAQEPDEGSAVKSVRDMILERVGENGLVDDEQIRTYVRRANRKVWEKAIKQTPRPWETRSAEVDFPVADGKLPLSVLAGEDASQAGDLALTFGAAAVRKVTYLEASHDGSWYRVREGIASERWTVEPGGLSYVRTGPPAFFYIEGMDLRFSPPPASALRVRATFVPSLPDVQDQEHLLMGRFPEYHDLVATEAARLCFMRDERKATPWDAERDELLTDFRLALSSSQGSRVRRSGASNPFNS